MSKNWKFSRFRDLRGVLRLLALCLLFQSFGLCCSLNQEGEALLKLKQGIVSDPFGALSSWVDDEVIVDPCNWLGVECLDGEVVVLNLKDLCLEGSLAPELTNLVHIKSIILRNNSFYGIIPEGIVHLKELEVLDLGYNNFSGPLPADLGSNISSSTLLLDNNDLLGGFSPEVNRLNMLSESQVDENQLISADKRPTCAGRYITRYVGQKKNSFRKLLLFRRTQDDFHNREADPPRPASSPKPDPSLRSPQPSPASASPQPDPPSPSPFPSKKRPLVQKPVSPNKNSSTSPQPHPPLPSPSPSKKPPLVQKPVSPNKNSSASPQPDPPSPSQSPSKKRPLMQKPVSPNKNSSASPSTPLAPSPGIQHESTSSKSHRVAIVGGVTGGAVFLIVSSIGIYLWKTNKVATVKPWATGLSGQLQKAFVTGVPKLKRSELEAACEDFSNVIGTSSIGTVYKGTLSSGVEIAVASVTITLSKDWSKTSEAQFRKKIDVLSKMNHKNFVNLLGYCEEEEPFTRMVIFEYAPNGTLFEHLHIQEAEHLDWGTRLRVAMGMAYCLQHMHYLDPPMAHSNLNSSAVQLTDDYAAKLADLSFLNEVASAEIKSGSRKHADITLASNVYSFGVILFEMVTGQLPYSADASSLEDWASHYLQGGDQPLKGMVDPTLACFEEEKLEEIAGLIKSCVNPNPDKRPKMKEVCDRLRQITKIAPEAAVPKLSPLWWAELEISSFDAS